MCCNLVWVLSSPVFIPLYLNFNSKVTKTKTKIIKAKIGKNSKEQLWTENFIAGIDQIFYVLLSDIA